MEPIAHGTPESILISSLDQQTIQAALDGLPVQYREVILLCDVEEMSYQEIAETLAIPIGTVMSRLSRGRKAMRELLNEASIRRAIQMTCDEIHGKLAPYVDSELPAGELAEFESHLRGCASLRG